MEISLIHRGHILVFYKPVLLRFHYNDLLISKSPHFIINQSMNKQQQQKQTSKKEFQSSLISYLAHKTQHLKKEVEQKEIKKQQDLEVNKGENQHHGSKSPQNVQKQQMQNTKQKAPQNNRQTGAHTLKQKQKKVDSNRSSQTDRMSSISAKSSSPQVIIEKKQPPHNINVLFYLSKTQSQPYGEYIDKMHQFWYADYDKLQRDHSFIQWIFPNSFQSRFNIQAKPLSPTEAEQFRTNPQIIDRYLKSYDMMLAFYGMKLKDRQTGEIVRSRNPDFKERMHKTLLTSFHNHMRITRILCSLTQTGFGMYAAQLCKFLKHQIYDTNGFMNSLQRYGVYKDWKTFQIYVQDKGLKNMYLKKINKKKEQTKVVLAQKTTEQQKKDKAIEQNLKEKDDPSILQNPAIKKQQ